MSIDDYFKYLAELIKTNPPAAEDAPMVARMAAIGLVPGQDFDPTKLEAVDKDAIKTVPKLAAAKILGRFKEIPNVNGWSYPTNNIGRYGTDYLQRALITFIGLGANLPPDAIYPTSRDVG